MGQDTGWKGYFSEDERYVDVINGIGCKGRQVVTKDDLREADTQTDRLPARTGIHPETSG